jgi:hypothetical protein
MNNDELDRELQAIRAKLWSEIYVSSFKNGYGEPKCGENADNAIKLFEERRLAGKFRGE